jgi:DNA-binding HxlR family transcriptional regulator
MEGAKGNFETCPMGVAIGMLGGKWKLAVVWRLQGGTMRFNELNRSLGEVTPKVLAQQLKELEADGIVSRLAFAEIPPRVEYGLTDTGRSLAPVLDSLCAWGKDYLALRTQARETV